MVKKGACGAGFEKMKLPLGGASDLRITRVVASFVF
jgi:hypothetical protein